MYRANLFNYFIVASLVLGVTAQTNLEGANQRISTKNYYKFAIPKNSNFEKMEDELVQMINAIRLEEGLSPLKQHKELAVCARQHSDNMAKKIVKFGHDGFEDRSKQMKNKIKLQSFGENVAYSFNVENPLKAAVKGWMNSTGHKRNILGNFNLTGIGISYNKEGYCYITQLFAKVLK